MHFTTVIHIAIICIYKLCITNNLVKCSIVRNIKNWNFMSYIKFMNFDFLNVGAFSALTY